MNAAQPLHDGIASNGILERCHDNVSSLAFADRIAVSMSVTRYPVRSSPNGYGIGVVKPNTENVPIDVNTARHIVLLGVGVIVNAACWDLVPPNVAMTLSLKRSTSSGAT
jgi:hypothetical protein